MGGASQSRELLTRIEPERVFINENQEEVLKLLSLINDTYTLSMRGRVLDGDAASPDSSMGNVEDDEDGPGKFTEEEIEQLFQPYKYLYLANYYLGDVGVLHEGGLATVSKNKYLHTLDLSYNALTAISLGPLLRTLRQFPNFSHLSLGGNNFGEDGCRLIAKWLAEDPPLQVLSLFHCGLTDENVLLLLNGLRSNTHLRLLNLDFNFCTWKFLRALISLVKVNSTLAVVLFQSVPHDPLTLTVLPQDTVSKIEYPCTPAGYFRSWRTYYQPEGLSDGEQRAAAERFFLRRLVCRADFTGLKPFPPSLLKELESYLAPRRKRYVGELSQIRQAALESAMKCVVGAATHEAVEEEAEQEEVEEHALSTATTYTQDSTLPEVVSSTRRATNPRRRRQTATFSGSIRRELPPLNSPQRLEMVMNDAHSFRQKLNGAQRGQPSTATGKVLPNGFDRIWVAAHRNDTTATSGNHVVTGKPSLLKACWCDPHDAASPFAGRLHYHCKREEYIDYSQSKKSTGKPAECASPKKMDSSTSTLDSKAINDSSQQKPAYHGCQGTGHRCCSMRTAPGTPASGMKGSQGGGPPRNSVTFTNKDGLVMELHYNPVLYFTAPYQPSAQITEDLSSTS